MSIPRRHELAEIVTGGLLLTLPALCWRTVTGSPALLIAGCVLSLIAAYARKPLPSTTRAIVWTPVLMALLFIFLAGDHFFGEDIYLFFPSHKYVPVLAGIGYAALFLRQRLWQRVTIQCVSFLCLVLQGVPNANLPEYAQFYMQLAALYALLFTAHTIAYSHQAHGIIRGVAHERLDWRKSVILALCLVVAGGGGLSLRGGFFATYAFMQRLVPSLMDRNRFTGNWFERSSDLWRSPAQGYMSQRRVTLRVLSPRPPGYLRGYAFQNYGDGRWTGRADMMPAAVTTGAQTNAIMSAYLRPEATAPLPMEQRSHRLRIFPVGGFRSRALLHPGAAWRFELAAEDLRGNADGEMVPVAWASQAGYAVDAATGPTLAAYNGPLDPLSQATYQFVTAELTNAIAHAAQEAFAGVAHGDARAAARAAENFFHRSFVYQLGVRFSRRRDPLEQFLQRRRGHCELFASATTLLLRAHGVAARYVTGCVCMESVGGDYWVARQNSGHAWVEAFDPIDRKWFLVEPTPPDSRPPTEAQFRWFGQTFDRLRFQLTRFRAWIAQGRLATIIVGARDAVGTALGWITHTPLAWGTILLMALSALLLRIRRWQQHRAATAPDEATQLLAHAAAHLDRLLRTAEYTRNPTETYRHAITQLPHPTRSQLTDTLNAYEQLRYSPAARQHPDTLAALRQLLPQRAGNPPCWQ